MADNHILLLPREKYFEWVRATVNYVLAFGVSITPDPKKAGLKKNITVIVVPGAYAEQGDIVSWLSENFPESKIDPIRVSSPEDLIHVFQNRLDIGMELGTLMSDGTEDGTERVHAVQNTEMDNREAVQRNRLSEKLAGADRSDNMGITRTEAREQKKDVESPQTEFSLGEKAKEQIESIGHPFRLSWPTDYAEVTQAFAANPEIYSKWGLPGHEGIDIRAPMNTNVYACAAGEVYFVAEEATGHPYGKHIRIRHAGGYRTVYAHLASVGVVLGEKTKSGQLIGKADSTGNSTGAHLHLTLKKEGATVRKETQFKGDVIDPTPFLMFPNPDGRDLRGSSLHIEYPWNRPLLLGLNIRDDGFMHDPDFAVVQQARIEAIKIQENTPTKSIQRLFLMRKDMFIVAQLAFDLGQTNVSSSEWTSRIMPDIARLYALGIRYFEIHQSPNLQAYGWNYSWHSGGGFARWWLDIVHRLRDRYPEAKFGFPGVSPGGQVEGQRLDASTFMEQADDAVHAADWVGVNCFWSDSAEMEDEEKGAFYKIVRRRFPDKLIFVTEFGNVNAMINPYVKGNEYLKFYQALQSVPGVGAAFSQVMSSATGFNGMQWRLESGELTQIPLQIGKRKN